MKEREGTGEWEKEIERARQRVRKKGEGVTPNGKIWTEGQFIKGQTYVTQNLHCEIEDRNWGEPKISQV